MIENTHTHALEKLAGTLACDASGRPLVLHHGTYSVFDRFEKTKDIGFHFGTRMQAIDREWQVKRKPGQKWHLKTVCLAAKKVLVYPDDPRTWLGWQTVLDFCDMTDPDRIGIMHAEGIKDVPAALVRMRQFLLEDGYDAIAYRNVYEAPAGKSLEWSWVALHDGAIVPVADNGKVTLQETVGNPALALPTSMKDIPGAVNKSGTIRYNSCKRDFLAMAIDFCRDNGGTLVPDKRGPLEWSSDIQIPINGETWTGFVQPDLGRFRVVPPERVLAVLIENLETNKGTMRTLFETHEMNLRYGHGFNWRPGEHIADFRTRLERELAKLADITAPQPEFTPA